MERQVIPVDVDGATILVEATVRGGDEEIAGAGIPSFGTAWKSVTKLVHEIAKSLNDVKPSHATIEFGCQFALENGHLTALVVSGSASGSIKVTLDWEKNQLGA